MVEQQLLARGLSDPDVLAAMREVPRHRFVPDGAQGQAYADHPLPIGYDVTISQPYVVALMTELAAVRPGDRVLEIGTGSGYQAAVLAQLGAEVDTIEIIEPLAVSARQRLAALGYERIHVRHGDGHIGWPDRAPYAAIVLTAAPTEVPPALIEQLALGGRLVAPVGPADDQRLIVLTRTPTGVTRREEGGVRFVPMIRAE
jgi:protein-L-isoaspartate(D-aspartate) O-methyltransferase